MLKQDSYLLLYIKEAIGFAQVRRGSSAAALHGAKGAILFHKREWPPLNPPRERFSHCKRAARRAAMLAESTTCVAALLRSPPMVLQNDLPLLLLPAVAQPLAALLPYGCGTPLAGAALPVSWQCSLIPVYRQSPQCGERSNAAISHAVCRRANVTRASR